VSVELRVKSPPRFAASLSRVAARARQLTKPIVAVKVDRSPVGTRAALVYTSSEVGEDKVCVATDGTNSEALAAATTTYAATVASG
jgi:acyl-CoA synthetase (NDP forming)